MAQGPSDTISVAIRITLRIRESKVRNPDPPDRRRFVLSDHSFLFGNEVGLSSFIQRPTDIQSAATKTCVRFLELARQHMSTDVVRANVQLIPLPFTVSCSSKSRLVIFF